MNEMMEKIKRCLAICFALLLSGLGGIGAGYAAYSALKQGVMDYKTLPNAVHYDNGSFMMAGISIGLLAFFVAMVYGLLKKEVERNKEFARHCVVTATIGLGFALITPFITGPLYEYKYVEKEGYELCEDASSQWLYLTNKVYVVDQQACHQYLIDEEKAVEQRWADLEAWFND